MTDRDDITRRFPPGPVRRLTDYRAHYTTDAEAIVGPEELTADRRASERRRVAELLRHLAPRAGERVLDAGCGSGWLAHSCSRSGARGYALDIAVRGVAAARRRYPDLEWVVVGDLYALPFASASLDAVVLSEVVEHLEDIPRALGEVRRILRPRGRVLVSVPYQERIAYHLCIHCNRFTPANAHLHSFGPGDLEGLLVSCDLEPRGTWVMTNKLLERLAFPRHSGRWPQRCWRLTDAMANRVFGHAGFVCVLAFRMV